MFKYLDLKLVVVFCIFIVALSIDSSLQSVLSSSSGAAIVISAIVAALFASSNLKHSVHAAKAKNALDFEADYKNNEDVQNSFKVVREVIRHKSAAEIEEIAGDIDNPEAHSIVTILNEWERVGNAVHEGLYDEEFLYRAHGTNLIRLVTLLYPFIKVRQKKNHRVYKSLCWLVIKWMAREDQVKSNQNKKNLINAQRYLNKYFENH